MKSIHGINSWYELHTSFYWYIKLHQIIWFKSGYMPNGRSINRDFRFKRPWSILFGNEEIKNELIWEFWGDLITALVRTSNLDDRHRIATLAATSTTSNKAASRIANQDFAVPMSHLSEMATVQRWIIWFEHSTWMANQNTREFRGRSVWKVASHSGTASFVVILESRIWMQTPHCTAMIVRPSKNQTLSLKFNHKRAIEVSLSSWISCRSLINTTH